MTQIQTLSTSALRPSSGRQGWTLEIYSPTGNELLTTYDSHTNPGPIHSGFNSRRYPNNTCGPGSFMAVPKRLIGGDPRNIVKLTYDTGTKRVPVYFGYIAKAPDPRKGDVSRYDLSSGKELLKNSPIRSTFTWAIPQLTYDVSVWISNLVSLFKHPALKHRFEDFPLTGVLIPAPEVRGTNLYQAIEAILKAVPALKDTDWGVDPEGYVVVRPATGSKVVYAEDATLRFGDRDGEQICTEAIIRVANRVSEGAIISAGYTPSLITYTYTDPANEIYRAPKIFDLPRKSDDSPILEVLEYTPASAFSYEATVTQWKSSTTNSASNVGQVVQDSDLATYAVSGSNSEVSMAVAYANPAGFVGLALAIDAAAGNYTSQARIRFSGSSAVYTVKFDLEKLKGQGKVEARFIAPYPLDATINQVHASVFFTSSSAMTDLIKVYEFRGLKTNDAILSQIAQSNIRLPARQVSQITFARSVTEGGQAIGGYLLETPVKTLQVMGEDGKLIACEVTEYNDTCTTEEGMLTRAETGEPIRNPIVDTINGAIRRAQEVG